MGITAHLSSLAEVIHFCYTALMATLKKRINVSVSKEMDATLEKLAERDEMPVATKAEHLLRIALEIEEDEVLDAIASRRDRGSARFVPHSAVWR